MGNIKARQRLHYESQIWASGYKKDNTAYFVGCREKPGQAGTKKLLLGGTSFKIEPAEQKPRDDGYDEQPIRGGPHPIGEKGCT
jgi:hypothetical protein